MAGTVRFVSQVQNPLSYVGTYSTISGTALQGNPFSSLGETLAGCQFGPGVNLDQIRAFEVRLSESLSVPPIASLFSEPESLGIMRHNVEIIAPELSGTTDVGKVLEALERKLFSEDASKPSPIKLQLILPKPGTGNAILAISHDQLLPLGTAKAALRRAGTTKLQAPETKKQPEAAVGPEERIEEPARTELFRGQIVRFYITLPDGTRRLYILEPGKSITIGSGMQNDIPIEDEKVSKSHLRIHNQDGLLFVEDLKDSNGTHIGRATVFATNITETTSIVLGSTQSITLEPIAPANTRLILGIKIYKKGEEGQIDQSKPLSTVTHSLNPGETLQIGRKEGAPIKLQEGDISETHCVLTNKDGVLRIEDQSSQGTFDINMQKLPAGTSALVDLTPGYYWVGPYLLEISIERIEAPSQGQGPAPLAVSPVGDAPIGDSEAPAIVDEGPIGSATTLGPEIAVEEDQGEVIASARGSIPLGPDEAPQRSEVEEAVRDAIALHAEAIEERTEEGRRTDEAVRDAIALHRETIEEEARGPGQGTVPAQIPKADDTRPALDSDTGTIAVQPVGAPASQEKGKDQERGQEIPQPLKAEEAAPVTMPATPKTDKPSVNPIIRFFLRIYNFFVSLYNKWIKRTSKKGPGDGPEGQASSSQTGTSGPQGAGSQDKGKGGQMEEAGVTEEPEGTTTYTLRETLSKINEARQPYGTLYSALLQFNQANRGDNDEVQSPELQESRQFLKIYIIDDSDEGNLYSAEDLAKVIEQARIEDLSRIYHELQRAKEALAKLQRDAADFLASHNLDEADFNLDSTDISADDALLRLQAIRKSFQILHSALKAYRKFKVSNTIPTPPLMPDDLFIKKDLLYSKEDIKVAINKAISSDISGIDREIERMESILQEEIDTTLGVPPIPEEDDEITRLRAELEASRRELQQLREENTELSRAIKELQQLRDENAGLSQAIVELRRNAKKATQLLGGAASALKTKTETIEELRLMLNALLDKIERLGEEETSDSSISGVSSPDN